MLCMLMRDKISTLQSSQTQHLQRRREECYGEVTCRRCIEDSDDEDEAVSLLAGLY